MSTDRAIYVVMCNGQGGDDYPLKAFVAEEAADLFAARSSNRYVVTVPLSALEAQDDR